MSTLRLGWVVAGVILLIGGAASAQTAPPPGSHFENGVIVSGPGSAPETGSQPVFGSQNGTLITFDNMEAPCDFAQTTRLTTEFEGLGVIFEGPGGDDGGAVLNQCGGFEVSDFSPPNFLAFNCEAKMFDGGIPEGPETFLFDPPVTKVTALVGSDETGSATLEAFNASAQMVDSQTVTLSIVLAPISVSGPGITRVVLTFTSCIFVLDNLDFGNGAATAAPVLSQTAIGALVLVLLFVGIRQLPRRRSN